MTPRRSPANLFAVTFRALFVALASVFAAACLLFAGGLALVLLLNERESDVVGVLLMCVGWPLALVTWLPLRKARRELRDERQWRDTARSVDVSNCLPLQISTARWVFRVDSDASAYWRAVKDDSTEWTPCQPTAEERDE